MHIDIDADKPTEGADKKWQALYSAQLVYETSGQIKPVLSYRAGKEQGLDYDKQLILGLLWDFVSK